MYSHPEVTQRHNHTNGTGLARRSFNIKAYRHVRSSANGMDRLFSQLG
jgi:hypothetical protein